MNKKYAKASRNYDYFENLEASEQLWEESNAAKRRAVQSLRRSKRLKEQLEKPAQT